MSFNTDTTTTNATTGVMNFNMTDTNDLTLFNADIDTTAHVWNTVPSPPTKEFLEMWKWLRTKLLKELLSDDPKGIQIVKLTQDHQPQSLPKYIVTIEFYPTSMSGNRREFDKPEIVPRRSQTNRGSGQSVGGQNLGVVM